MAIVQKFLSLVFGADNFSSLVLQVLYIFVALHSTFPVVLTSHSQVGPFDTVLGKRAYPAHTNRTNGFGDSMQAPFDCDFFDKKLQHGSVEELEAMHRSVLKRQRVVMDRLLELGDEGLKLEGVHLPASLVHLSLLRSTGNIHWGVASATGVLSTSLIPPPRCIRLLSRHALPRDSCIVRTSNTSPSMSIPIMTHRSNAPMLLPKCFRNHCIYPQTSKASSLQSQKSDPLHCWLLIHASC